MKVLCIDFGNTVCKAAIVEDNAIVEKLYFEQSQATSSILFLIEKHSPTYSILVSVIHHEQELENILKSKTEFILFQHHTPIPFSNTYASPETLGLDRLALVSAASTLFPQKAALVIAMGTCITYNFINQKNEFLGGSISPGVEMRFKALQHFTQKLPLVKNIQKIETIGTNTEQSLQSGVVNGIRSEIDGIIEAYQQQFGNINVVLTGGDMPQFEMQLKNEIFADANFLFKGLYAIVLHHI